MLGNTINVQINPEPIYYGTSGGQQYTVRAGFAHDDSRVNTLHHILLFTTDEAGRCDSGSVRVKVMAVTEIEDKIYYICAHDGHMLFEPIIREVLRDMPGLSSAQITCLYEKSCGAVIFRRHSGNVEYLLIKNKKGNNWGFPKGHMEIYETERETAIREVKEETGLSIQPIKGFRTISEYHPKGRITKQVIFFIAEMTGEDVVIQKSEIERFIWADYALAIKTFKFSNDKKVLAQAKSWINDRLY